MGKLPVYRIFIDEEEGAVVYRNSIVTDPAHGKKQYAFNKEAKKIEFSDVKQNIIGVAISPDTPIYRNDSDLGEYYVVFEKNDVEQMAYSFAKNNYHNELDFEHNDKDRSKSAVCYFSFIIDRDKGLNPPDAFKDEPDGTWLLGYHFYDKKEYEKAKSKGGFSVEGTFLIEKISKQFKNNNMKKDEKKASAFSKIISFIEDLGKTEEKFEDVTLEDGTMAKHEGVGTPLLLVTEDGEITAEDGTYTTDGGVVITVLEGLVSEVSEVVEEEMEDKPKEDNSVNEFAEATSKAFEKLFKQNEEIQKTNQELSERIKVLEEKPAEKPTQKFERSEGLNPVTQRIMNQVKNK